MTASALPHTPEQDEVRPGFGFSKAAEERQATINKSIENLRARGVIPEAQPSKLHGSVDDLTKIKSTASEFLREIEGKPPPGRLRRFLRQLFT